MRKNFTEARILDGREVAGAMRAEMKAEAARLKKEHGVVPGLAAVLVGDDPASMTYITTKQKACRELGIRNTIQSAKRHHGLL